MNVKNRLTAGLLSAWMALALNAQTDRLKTEITDFLQGKRAEVGVAVIANGQDTLTVNNDAKYPLMSVMKLHQAVATAHWLHDNSLPLSTEIPVKKEEMKTNTYSPLRDKLPYKDLNLRIDTLLAYTLQQSDNNACDILFAHTCSPQETDRRLRTLGLKQFAISVTEDDMHQQLQTCYSNWSTPLETARLLEMLYTRKLPGMTGQDFLQHMLNTCTTGQDRLAHPLKDTGAVIGHKTGTGDRNAHGQIIGLNDAGFVRLPDGRHYTIVVFIKDSEETADETAHIIAHLSRLVYDTLSQPQ